MKTEIHIDEIDVWGCVYKNVRATIADGKVVSGYVPGVGHITPYSMCADLINSRLATTDSLPVAANTQVTRQ